MTGARREWAWIREVDHGKILCRVRCTVHHSSYEEISENDEEFSGETAVALLYGIRGKSLKRGMSLTLKDGRVFRILNVSPGLGRVWTAKLHRCVFTGEA